MTSVGATAADHERLTRVHPSYPVSDARVVLWSFRWRRLIRLLIVIGLLSPIVFLVVASLGPISPGLIGGIAGAGVVLAMGMLGRYQGYELARDLRRRFPPNAPPESLDAVARGLNDGLRRCDDRGLGAVSVRRHVARLVQGLTSGGHAVRLASDPDTLPAIPEPFHTPFEPTPLHDRAASYAELTNDRIDHKRRVRWAVESIGQALGTGRWGIWLYYVLLALGVIALTSQALLIIRQLARGQAPEMLIWIGLWLGIAFIGYFYQLLRSPRWLLVPRGVLIVPGPLTRQSTRLFTRDDCTILYWRDGGRVVIVRSDDAFVHRRLTPAEMDGLWRAWLSPLPAPDLSRASDFLV